MADVNNQRPGDNPGYVYLALREDGCYKIGYSRYPEYRINKEFRYQYSQKITLYWSLKCADQVTTERALHTRFRDKHTAAEWFELSPEDVAWITAQTEETICAEYDRTRSFSRLKPRSPHAW